MTTASRRTVLRALAASAAVPALGGCAGLSLSGPAFEAAEISAHPTLLVATTRKPVDDARAEPWFGPERAARLSVARARLTPPPEGRFTLSSVGLNDWRIEAVETVPRVSDLIATGAGLRDVLIYVHGFNQSFETAALDAAQLSDGVKFRGETMVFAWPS